MPATRHGARRAQNDAVAVSKLPHELLCEIFCFARSTYGRNEKGLVQYLSAISSTCVLWRAVALSTASLWTTIAFTFHLGQSYAGALTRRQKSQLNCYLKRSKQRAIDVYISVFDHDEVKISRILKKTILPHLSRCRSLRAELVTERQAQIIFPLPRHLPHLRTLRCALRNDNYFTDDPPPHMQLLSDKTHSPCLKDVDFLSSRRALDSALGPFTHFGTIQLTSLKICGPAGLWGETLALLTATAFSLRWLHLGVPPSTLSSNTELPRTLFFPKLHSLFISGDDPGLGIQAPALKTFGSYLNWEQPRRPLLSLGPTPLLQTVILCGRDTLEDNIRTLLLSNHTITTLGFYHWGRRAVIPFLTMLGGNEEADAGMSTVRESGSEDGHDEGEPNPTLDFLPSLKFLSITDPSRSTTPSRIPATVCKRRPHLRIVGNGRFRTLINGSQVIEAEANAIAKAVRQNTRTMNETGFAGMGPGMV